MDTRSKVVFASFAIGLVVTLAISLISLSLIQAAFVSALLTNSDSLVSYTSVVNDSSKLRFTLSMNSSILTTGNAIDLEISEQNTLPLTNTVASAHDWPTLGLTDSNCGVLNYPMGYAIFKGYHLQTNLPTADRLDLFRPGDYLCPEVLSNISSYVFAPGNDSASINERCGSNSWCMTIPMQSGGPFKGYWSSNIPYLSSATFHSFSPGVYTVVGGDEWSDLLILHFVIS